MVFDWSRHSGLGSKSPRSRLFVRLRCGDSIQCCQWHRHDMSSPPVGNGRLQMALQWDSPYCLVCTQLLLQVSFEMKISRIMVLWFYVIMVITSFIVSLPLGVVMSPPFWNSMNISSETSQYLKQHLKIAEVSHLRNHRPIISYEI